MLRTPRQSDHEAMKSKRQKLPYKLVMVEWVDASRLSDGWMDLSAIPVPYWHRCVSVGFLVADNARGVIVVPTIGDVEHADNRHTYGGMLIPRGAIRSMKVLE